MKSPLQLHLKAALICALIGVVFSLPLLWLPLLPGWPFGRPHLMSPRAEALLAVLAAVWTAWCVVDIPRRGLKVLIWAATLWILASGLWIVGLYGWPTNALVPLTAVGLAGAGGMIFSLTPAGSRRSRWEKLVGPRVSPEVLRSAIDERYLQDEPRTETLAVVELLWPGQEAEGHEGWLSLSERSQRAAAHFLGAGAYMERCDGEGARFVFGCWGTEAPTGKIIGEAWNWVKNHGGCAVVTRGDCVTGVVEFTTGPRWTLGGSPMRRAARMAAATRGYAARLVIEDSLLRETDEAWTSRRLAWWDFEGERVLLREITGVTTESSPDDAEASRRWDRAWDAFWSGDWATAENVFASLAREREDSAARIFAMRSEAARRQDSEK